MPKSEIKDRCTATLTLRPHDAWFIKAMLDEFLNMRSITGPHEALGLDPNHEDNHTADFIDDVATELFEQLKDQ